MGFHSYSTDIDISDTLKEIEELLKLHGARDIRFVYDVPNPTITDILRSIDFVLILKNNEEEKESRYKIPVNSDITYEILRKQSISGTIKISRNQYGAENVICRVIKTWLEVQLAFIQMNLLSADHIFSPFSIN